jgi:hypothetical protein
MKVSNGLSRMVEPPASTEPPRSGALPHPCLREKNALIACL